MGSKVSYTSIPLNEAGAAPRRSWIWLGLLGVLFSAGIGIFAGAQALLQPANWSPYDRTWGVVYVGLFLAVGALCWLRRGRLLLGLVAAVVPMLAAAMAIGAHAGLALLGLLWLLVAAVAVGDWLLGLLVPSTTGDLLDRLILGTALALGALAFLTLAAALLHWLYPPVAYGLLAGLTLLFLPRLIRTLHPLVQVGVATIWQTWQTADLRFPAFVAGSVAICFLGGLVWALAPSVHYDALVYHLSVPAIYVQQHGLVDIPEQYRAYWAHNAEMLYTLSLLLVGQPLPSLLHLTYGLLNLGLVFALGRRLAGVRVGLLAALLFYSLPIVTWESGTAYADLMVSLYALASLYAGLMWWLQRNPEWLPVAGIMGGLALGTKLSAAAMVVPVALLLGGGLLYRTRSARDCLAGLLRFGAPALLLAAPWLIRDWLWSGSPIFPFYNSIFRSTKWMLQAQHPGRYRKLQSLLALLRLPWDLVLRIRPYDVQAARGSTGALPLLALPWLYWLPRWSKRAGVLLLSLPTGLAVVLWFWLVPNLRYLLPVFPAAALLAALNLEALRRHCSPHRWRQPITALGLVMVLAYLVATRLSHMQFGWQIPERYPYRLVFGLEDQEGFLSRALPLYDVFRFLDRQGGGQARVLVIGNDQIGPYANSRLEPLNCSWGLRSEMDALGPGEDLLRALQRRGYTFIVVDRVGVLAEPERYTGLALLDDAFLHRFARLEYARQNLFVYRFVPEGVTAIPLPNLLSNSGFEEIDTEGGAAGWFVFGSPVFGQEGGQPHSGQVAVQASGRGWIFQPVPVEAGQLYTLSHWTRADRPGQQARLQINWLNADGKQLEVTIDIVPVSDTWQQQEMPVTAPPGAAVAEVYVSVHDDSEVWFDDFSFIKGEP